MAPVLTVIGATAAVFILSIGMMTFFVVNPIRSDIAQLGRDVQQLGQDVKHLEIEVSGLKVDMEIVKSLLLPKFEIESE